MHADYTENKWFSMCTEFSTEVGITAWPHHWMFTAVTVLVPSACALASCMEQHFTSGMHSMSDLWSFPRPFIRRVYSYISLPVKSKAAICDGVGWLVGWRPTNLCVPNICIIPLIYNPTIQLYADETCNIILKFMAYILYASGISFPVEWVFWERALIYPTGRTFIL